MIEELSGSAGNVLGFRLVGEITDEDYTGVLIPALIRAIEEYGIIRLMIDLVDFQSEDMGAMDDDVREKLRIADIEREAIIGDEGWEARLNYLDYFFLFPNTDVRFFREEHRGAAWEWLREGMLL
jgi:hypothetical protein